MCLPNKVQGQTIQRIAASIGALQCFNFGLMFGITPEHIRLYQTDETPLNRVVDADSATWVCSSLFLSAAVGSLVFGLASKNIGPRSILLLSGLLQVASWFCIHFAYDIVHIYSSRILAGVASGAAFVVLPFFIDEISEDSNSGSLAVAIDQWRTFGIITGFALSSYLSYDLASVIGVGISCFFVLTFPFVQESPFYYMRKGNEVALEKSLRWFRGIRDINDRDNADYVHELEMFKAKMTNKQIAFFGMPRAFVWKSFVYCLVLTVGAQLTGVYVILAYGIVEISNAAAGPPNDIIVLILAGIPFVGANLAGCVLEKISRKIFLGISALVCCLSLISLCLFLHYGNNGQINTSYAPWFEIGLLSLHMASANMGMYPLATIMINEILPYKLRAYISSVVWAISWLLVSFLIQGYHNLVPLIGLIGYFWLFASVCLLSAIFALVLLPDTRGKTLEEVGQSMGYVANGSVAKITDVMNGYISQGGI